MYIRTKKRVTKKGEKKYAYLVSAKYYRKGPRQKVKEYLGRVWDVQPIKESVEKEFDAWPKCISQVLAQELERHGFVKQDQQWINNEWIIDEQSKTVISKNGDKACLKVNYGFLCDYTLKSILEFEIPKANEKEMGKDLGNKLLLAGIHITPERFLSLFEKLKEHLKQR